MRIETIEDVRTWIAEHDGRNNAYWRQQHEWNGIADKKFSETDKRITAVEKRVIFWAGAAATLGALIGSGIGSIGG
jgi:hypothetical protein